MSMHPRVVKALYDAPIAHVNLAFEASLAFDPPDEKSACITNRLVAVVRNISTIQLYLPASNRWAPSC